MKQTSTAWIFVSHSNRDLSKVRLVRDALEKAGAERILFFLKCLSDHDEIDGLIEREIDARYFFRLCDSANAKKSAKQPYELCVGGFDVMISHTGTA
jgi:hypothetical protein